MTATKKNNLEVKGIRKARPKQEPEFKVISSYNARHIYQSSVPVNPPGSIVIDNEFVNRAWENVRGDWATWNARSLTHAPIERVILDSVPLNFSLDHAPVVATTAVAMGVRPDGETLLLAVKGLHKETEEEWNSVLDDLMKRGLQDPLCLITDGAPALENAIARRWDGIPVQRCADHTLRELLALAPERLRSEISDDYNNMIYAYEPEDISALRKGFMARWRRRCRPVAEGFAEVGDKLFAFIRPPLPPRHSDRDTFITAYAIECLLSDFKRRINSKTVMPAAETAEMLFASAAAINELTKILRGSSQHSEGDWPSRIGLLWRCFNASATSGASFGVA